MRALLVAVGLQNSSAIKGLSLLWQ